MVNIVHRGASRYWAESVISRVWVRSRRGPSAGRGTRIGPGPGPGTPDPRLGWM